MPALTLRTLVLLSMATLTAACSGGTADAAPAMAAPAPSAAAIVTLAAVGPNLAPATALAATVMPHPYLDGTILPNHLTPAQLDEQVQQFYRQWRALYVVQDCGPGRYFVKVDADGKAVGGGTAPGTITVSEAHGYGMLISVMMANHDPDAQTIFDGMLLYFHDHPASSDRGLLAWNQVAGCKNSAGDFRGDTSATDGDLDIAYALLLADRQWGSAGAINYRQEAQAVMQAIMAHEVHATGKHLLIGDWAGRGTERPYEHTTRTSDFMLSHLNAFAGADGDARWLAVRDRSYAIIDEMLRTAGRQTGLVPDFVVALDTTPKPAASGFLEGKFDGDYSWNASRYPWRVGLDYLLYGEQRAFDAMVPLNRWARSSTGDDPRKFASTYRLDGTALTDEVNQLAFVAALGVSAMISPDNQAWLNTIWDDLQGQTLQQGDYYGNTLKMLGMLTMAGQWQKPAAAP